MWVIYTLNGLYFAALLFLTSLGLNIILGVMGILNLAHGSLYAIGAFMAAWTIIQIVTKVPEPLLYVSLLSGFVLAGIVGWVMEKTLIRAMYKRTLEYQLLLTFGALLLLEDLIKKTDYHDLRLIPSDFSFRNMDTALDDVKKSKTRLADTLDQLKDSFDLVFLDCPPGISLLAENIFYASDYILIPIIPTPLSIRSFEQILSFYQENELDSSVLIPFFSMVEMRKKIHSSSIEVLKDKLPNLCMSYIPYSSDIEKMGVYQKPVLEFRKTSKASESYRLLWGEIKSKYLNKK
ncbi:MAG: AAA family ATPase [Thermodesulfobacteriota bacterium]